MDKDMRAQVESQESARDPVYVAACNGLVPLACKRATQRVKDRIKAGGKVSETRKGVKGSTYVHDFWNEFYHDEMNKLKREHGLLP